MNQVELINTLENLNTLYELLSELKSKKYRNSVNKEIDSIIKYTNRLNPNLENIFSILLCYRYLTKENDEYSMYLVIYDYLHLVLPNRNIKNLTTEYKENIKTDLIFTDEDNFLIPIEVKKDSVNSKALKQLQNYMSKLNSKEGILIGRELNTKLPSNIIFIPYSKFQDILEFEDRETLSYFKDSKTVLGLLVNKVLDK